MARRRGLYASKSEAEKAWLDAGIGTAPNRLGLAWRLLFPHYDTDETRLKQVSNAQLPAWVYHHGHIGLLVNTHTDSSKADIEWLSGAPEEPTNSHDDLSVLLPIAPLNASPASFLPTKQRGIATNAIFAALRAHAPIFRRVALASTLINLIAILSSLFAMQVYDRVVPNLAYATLWYLAAGISFAYLIDLLFKLSRLRLMEAAARRIDEALSLFIFDRLLGLKLDRRPAQLGSLVAQVRDYESIKTFLTSSTLFAIVDLPFIVFFVLAIYLIGGPVALVPSAFVVICAFIGIASYSPTARLQQLNNDAIIRRQGMLFEAVSGGEVIKSQGGEGRFSDVWMSLTRDSTDKAEALNTLNTQVQIATSFAQQIAYIGIIIAGVYVIGNGELTTGGLIACSILGGRALATISGISTIILRWHHARYSLLTLNQLLSCQTDEDDNRQANVHSVPLDLTAKNLSYQYPGATNPELSINSLTIPAGSRVAIVGRNGSGKSTLLKLLAGIATPSQGEITIANLNLEDCRPSWLREVIAYLPQEPRLFSGTLLENLCLGISQPDEEKIYAALEITGLLDAVKKHPLGLQLPIHEGGSGLSGGQRQLVALSRMVLQQPKLWLLDEPTANLDSNCEQLINKLLAGLPSDCTVIFTTHRKPLLDLADRALLLDSGQVKADAPPKELLATASGEQLRNAKTPSPSSKATTK